MHKCLYLLCPTDCLETVINKTFKNENYFYTSLGNSVVFTKETLAQIKKLLNKHKIKKVSFVLSYNNHIINDALYNQKLLTNIKLHNFYNTIKDHKKNTDKFWETEKVQLCVLSHYLNFKIKELQFELKKSIEFPIEMNAKVYDTHQNIFKNIYPELLCLDKHYLN